MARRALVLSGCLVVWLVLPALLPRSYVDLLVFAGLYAIAGLGVSLLLGYCGIVSLAQPVFYAIGAYSTAYLTVEVKANAFLAAIVGVALSTAIAYLLGRPILGLGGFYLALATLALTIIGTVLYLELTSITGGALGIGGIPRIGLGSYRMTTPTEYYYLVWITAFAAMWLASNVVHSRSGLAMRGMKDAPEAAMVLAVETRDLRLKMFVMSAVLGSVAGSLFAQYVTFVSAFSFDVDKSINFLLLAVLGGLYSVWGPVLGALFVTLVPEVLSRFGTVYQVLFGATLVAVVVVLPGGLASAMSRIAIVAACGRPSVRGEARCSADRA